MARVEWRDNPSGELRAYVDGHEAAWAPMPGSQGAFLECPVFECLYEGTRGPGKTEALLMDFAQHCGVGWGAEWRGIIFRHTYKQLDDVVSKTKKWFPRIFPDARYNESSMRWSWPDGETLALSYMERPEDYWNYHGHSYPFIGWEELTTWPTDECYKVMLSCSRSPKLKIPRKYRATTNSYGPGHGWVKARWRLPIPAGRTVGPIIRDDTERVAIHGELRENIVLARSDPAYVEKISAAARSEAERKAWVMGSWDIVAGGVFDDAWSEACKVPDIREVPAAWRVDRSYDHGISKPFSVGWWAESNGEPVEVDGVKIGAVKGDVIRIAEWYGWNGKPNEGCRMTAYEIARGILQREEELGLRGRVKPGPADSAIFDDWEPGKSVAGEMSRAGVVWVPADKGPGSRVQGWQRMFELMKAAAERPRERAALLICEGCEHFIRTVPTLPRSRRHVDDVDTDAEDHVADETRYRLRAKVRTAGSRSF